MILTCFQFNLLAINFAIPDYETSTIYRKGVPLDKKDVSEQPLSQLEKHERYIAFSEGAVSLRDDRNMRLLRGRLEIPQLAAARTGVSQSQFYHSRM